MARREQFLTKRLKLKVDKAMSSVAAPLRKFLGFSFITGTEIKGRVALPTLALFEMRAGEAQRLTCGKSRADRRAIVPGSRAYFGFCQTSSVLRETARS